MHLGKKPVDMSFLDRQREDRVGGINMWTIRECERDMVYSGTDDRNSDIADISDFSDDGKRDARGIPTGATDRK